MRRLLALAAMLLSVAAAAQIPSHLPIILGAAGISSSSIPILYVGTGAIQPPGGNYPSSAALPVPPGVIAGDYMLAFVWTYETFAATPPSGWTQLLFVNNGSTGAGLYYRVSTGSEPVSYSWSNAGNPGGGIRVYRNVSAATPIDASAGGSGPSGTNVSIPALTNTALPNELYVAFWENDNPVYTMTIPPGFGHIASSTNNMNFYFGDKPYPVKNSAVPVATATISGSNWWNCAGLTLRPLP